MFDLNAKKAAALLSGFIAAVPAWSYESSYNMTQGVTPVSHKVYDLHMTIFWVCVAIAVVVFGAMIYSLVAFRKSKGAVPDTTMLHSTKVEIVWTVIPVLILVTMAVPAAKTLIMMEDTRNSELSVKITGYQWQWNYEYLGQGVNFYSKLSEDSNEARQRGSGVDPFSVKDYLLSVDNPLVVPVDTKVRLLITGNDVIHAWWVPDFAIKKDAIPASSTRLGSRPRRSVTTSASAPSCAAATTASCRSPWMSFPRRISRSGSQRRRKPRRRPRLLPRRPQPPPRICLRRSPRPQPSHSKDQDSEL